MRKLIGLTSSVYQTKSGVEGVFAGDDYTAAIEKAGGLPMILPMLSDDAAIEALANQLDGLLLTGGVDVDPGLFGEQPIPQLGEVSPVRDDLECRLTEEFLARDKPIFAICRGVQLLNTVAGGSLYQDLGAQKRKVIQHTQKAPRWHASHDVKLTTDTKLQKIFECDSIRVNSYHHQAVKTVAKGFVVSAVAQDGVVEAIESSTHKFVVGVQWHPENMWRKYPVFHSLFQAFVDNC